MSHMTHMSHMSHMSHMFETHTCLTCLACLTCLTCLTYYSNEVSPRKEASPSDGNRKGRSRIGDLLLYRSVSPRLQRSYSGFLFNVHPMWALCGPMEVRQRRRHDIVFLLLISFLGLSQSFRSFVIIFSGSFREPISEDVGPFR